MAKCLLCKIQSDKPFDRGTCITCNNFIRLMDIQEQYMYELEELEQFREYLAARLYIVNHKLGMENQDGITNHESCGHQGGN